MGRIKRKSHKTLRESGQDKDGAHARCLVTGTNTKESPKKESWGEKSGILLSLKIEKYLRNRENI